MYSVHIGLMFNVSVYIQHNKTFVHVHRGNLNYFRNVFDQTEFSSLNIYGNGNPTIFSIEFFGKLQLLITNALCQQQQIEIFCNFLPSLV